jgi:acyl carrier protein
MAATDRGSETERQLSRFIAATLMHNEDVDTLDPDEQLLGSGILDSLGILRLVVFLEEEFGVVVPEVALIPEYFQTVRHLAALVEQLQASTFLS